MENNKEKNHEPTNGIARAIKLEDYEWAENITAIDLSKKNLKSLDEHIKLPPKLCHLDLSDNLLEEVPLAVLEVKHLKSLNLTNNRILYFDDTPKFCHSIENLKLGNNQLNGPPYWVWAESPRNLTYLDLSSNAKLCQSLHNGYYEELLQYKTLVKNIKIFNCRLRECLGLLGTFSKAEVLEIGYPDYSYILANNLTSVPCAGLDKCCDTSKLILSNTSIYSINTNIDIYKSLIEINLSHNCIHDIPEEFCNLENLEICVLSHNSIIYLPEDMIKLKKLVHLSLDNNKLCMLPKDIGALVYLTYLDVYNNCIYDIYEEIKHIRELDLAQNFFDEPEDAEYLQKKEKLRLNKEERVDGSKTDATSLDNDENYSPDTTDDEEYMRPIEEQNNKPSLITNGNDSSEEDWDSDDYWIPGFYRHNTVPPHQQWLSFVKRKMQEGNFCPMDMHQVSVTEQVQYEKLCSQQVQYESDGQFDDYSDDNS